MPAAAVIPAPIAYTKTAAVKKLVVGSLECFWLPINYHHGVLHGVDGVPASNLRSTTGLGAIHLVPRL